MENVAPHDAVAHSARVALLVNWGPIRRSLEVMIQEMEEQLEQRTLACDADVECGCGFCSRIRLWKSVLEHIVDLERETEWSRD